MKRHHWIFHIIMYDKYNVILMGKCVRPVQPTPVSLFHIRMLRSKEELQIRPSVSCITCTTLSVCPLKTRRVSPVRTLLMRMVLSHEPVQTSDSSCKRTEYCTASECPSMIRMHVPESMFHTRAVRSADPERIQPLPKSLRQNTESVCPSNVRCIIPVSRFQMRTVLSIPPLQRRPSFS